MAFGLVILVTLVTTLVVQRAALQPSWNSFVESFSLSKKGPEAAMVVAQNLAYVTSYPELRPILENLSQLYQAKIFLTDANGEVRVQSRFPEGIDLVESQIDTALGGNTTYGEMTVKGRRLAAVTSPVIGPSGFFGVIQIVEEPGKTPSMIGFPLTSSLLIGGMAALLAAIIIVYFLSRGITSPILAMRQTATRFAKGDLTARVKLDLADEVGELGKSFNRMAESLERTERIRRELMANISHELRTPLATIEGYAEGLIDEVIPSDQRQEALLLIYSESQRLERIVRSVLELSRLEAGKLPMEKVSFPLGPELQVVERLFSLRFEEKGIRFTVDPCAPDLQLTSDPDRLREVLQILLENAWQYTPAQGTVHLSLRMAGKELHLSVEDNGPGIEGEDLPYIFERFFRADKSHTRDTGGVGLGLAIAREIATALGGRLTVESQIGQGSRFTLTLPLEEETHAHPR
jgi:signal transduction histidine kinase